MTKDESSLSIDNLSKDYFNPSCGCGYKNKFHESINSIKEYINDYRKLFERLEQVNKDNEQLRNQILKLTEILIEQNPIKDNGCFKDCAEDCGHKKCNHKYFAMPFKNGSNEWIVIQKCELCGDYYKEDSTGLEEKKVKTECEHNLVLYMECKVLNPNFLPKRDEDCFEYFYACDKCDYRVENNEKK